MGDREEIDNAITKVGLKFSIKRMGKTNDYVGAIVIHIEGNMTIKQPKLIKSLCESFKFEVSKKRTPASPGQVLGKSDEEDGLMESEQKT